MIYGLHISNKNIQGETDPSDEMPRRQKRKSKSDRH